MLTLTCLPAGSGHFNQPVVSCQARHRDSFPVELKPVHEYRVGATANPTIQTPDWRSGSGAAIAFSANHKGLDEFHLPAILPVPATALPLICSTHLPCSQPWVPRDEAKLQAERHGNEPTHSHRPNELPDTVV